MFEGLFGTSYNPSKDIPDQTGKVFFVTGAYSGLGYVTTRHLARHGAKVYLACRSEDRTLAAIAKLEEEVPEIKGKERLRFIQVDMGNMQSVKRAAEEFIQKEKRLDVLRASQYHSEPYSADLHHHPVHNAGRLTTPYQMTEEGVELSMAVKYVTMML